MEGHGVFEGAAEVVRVVESPTRSAEPAIRALEHGVLGPDGTGLESSLVETADEGVRPALLDETTRGAGSDSPAAGGGWGAELDPVIPTLFPKDSPVSGVAMKHRGVTPRGWSTGSREQAEDRSSCIPDSSS